MAQFTARNLPEITTYAKAMEILGTENRVSLAPNTTLERDGTAQVSVYLYATPILTLTLQPGGTRLNVRSGGYRTVTTKQRLNRLLGRAAYVYQKKFTWYIVETYGKGLDFHHPFVEGYGLEGMDSIGRGFAGPTIKEN